MTAINPTTTEFQTLLAEYRAAVRDGADHLEIEEEEELDNHPGMAVRCVRDALEWLEATAGGLTLCTDAATRVRTTLEAALARVARDLEFEEEMGLDKGTRELEAQLREALALLEPPAA